MEATDLLAARASLVGRTRNVRVRALRHELAKQPEMSERDILILILLLNLIPIALALLVVLVAWALSFIVIVGTSVHRAVRRAQGWS